MLIWGVPAKSNPFLGNTHSTERRAYQSGVSRLPCETGCNLAIEALQHTLTLCQLVSTQVQNPAQSSGFWRASDFAATQRNSACATRTGLSWQELLELVLQLRHLHHQGLHLPFGRTSPLPKMTRSPGCSKLASGHLLGTIHPY